MSDNIFDIAAHTRTIIFCNTSIINLLNTFAFKRKTLRYRRGLVSLKNTFLKKALTKKILRFDDYNEYWASRNIVVDLNIAKLIEPTVNLPMPLPLISSPHTIPSMTLYTVLLQINLMKLILLAV
jgi:hypothetical protein